MAQLKTTKKKSFNMSRIRAKDTKIELILRKALWKNGHRYRKNDKSVFGKPDICFKSKKIAIFCDSSFWHGKNLIEGEVPENNRDFWVRKLQTNIQRDKKVNKRLNEEGWRILRFWDDQIISHTEDCVKKIESEINKSS